ncbi:MAG: metal ABC transporter substrate-binding protein [Acidimicrobiales bacterium]
MRSCRWWIPGAAAAAVVVVAACGSSGVDSGAGERPVVAAAFYPIEEVVREVGGDSTTVLALTPPGAEPHELEISGRAATSLSKAAHLFYLGGGFQPSVEKAAAGLPAGSAHDLLEAVPLLPADEHPGDEHAADEHAADEHREADPHVWLDPSNMARWASVVGEALEPIAPGAGARAQAYTERMAALDRRFEEGLATCASRSIVTSHRAFAYLGKAYGLEQIAVAGLSPHDEPDPQTLQRTAEAARAKGVDTIFFSEQAPKGLAETIAREVGAATAVLDPVETIDKAARAAGATYSSLMEENLAALRQALGCR